MIADRIVGRVGAEILRQRLADARQSDGMALNSAALFRLDKLTQGQIASVVREILAHPDLASRVEIKIPESLVEGEGLPDEVVTHLNAGAVRNIGTAREALLTATATSTTWLTLSATSPPWVQRSSGPTRSHGWKLHAM